MMLHCIYHIVFIHSSVDEYLGSFHFFGAVNNTAVNMGVQTSLQDPAFQSLGSAQVKLLEHLIQLTSLSQEPNQY